MSGQPGRPARLKLVAGMTPAQECEFHKHASECADMRWHWDGAYEFGHDGQQYWGRRSDNGEVIADPDLLTFRKMVRLDYHEHPVPRDPWTGGGTKDPKAGGYRSRDGRQDWACWGAC